MKNQINTINIAGAAVSASLLTFSCFLPSLSVFSFAKRIKILQNQKMYTPQKQTSLENDKKILPAISTATEISKRINHNKISQKQIASFDKKEREPKQLPDKCKEPSEPNGCPKNLDYFNMRPRPKQMPEECFSCKNLVTCVCLTGN